MRLIDEKGEQLGLIPLDEALELAKRNELDLVEVAPDAKPPVCKIMDYQRHVYEIKQKLKASRKKSRSQLKELKLRPGIDPHDFGIKSKRAREFLIKGHKVKITMRYRPREMRHYENGTKVLQKMREDLSDVAEIDTSPHKKQGFRSQVMILIPSKTAAAKKEAQAAKPGAGAED